jgi:ATP phosphoribosyltransferase
MMNTRLRIALQKKGKLAEDSLFLLKQCGLQFRLKDNGLLAHVDNFPIDLLFVRDDDIPTLVFDGLCDAGIVGENVLFEKTVESRDQYQVLAQLGVCVCRLSIAVPLQFDWQGPQSLNGKRIATSYSSLLRTYLNEHAVDAECIVLSGSVEMAPRMGMADVICDLVSTGQTLEENKLLEVDTVLNSQATFIQTIKPLDLQKQQLLEMLLRRIGAVRAADTRKYILFHAPISELKNICECLPGVETPTVLPLSESQDKVAVHVVSREQIFWDTLEHIQHLGATSILVLPIEKMLV